ncbi:hypothetical protein K4F52_006554 [Lecanicillium sp. MT-2017a]|nr:hypothetical protein K4F52_006554 [Lecanicillium sp. MT-2017a]
MASPFVLLWTTGSEEVDSAIALKFSPQYPIALIHNSQQGTKQTCKVIKEAGGDVSLFDMDLTKTEDLKKTVQNVVAKFGKKCAAAIYPVTNSPAVPFLKQTPAELRSATVLPISNAYAFAQQTVPLLLSNVGSSDFPSTLIFVGPSGNSSFDEINDNALVALSRSLGREFGKKCLHVANVKFRKGHESSSISKAKKKPSNASSISETIWHLYTQPLNCFSNEFTI